MSAKTTDPVAAVTAGGSTAAQAYAQYLASLVAQKSQPAQPGGASSSANSPAPAAVPASTASAVPTAAPAAASSSSDSGSSSSSSSSGSASSAGASVAADASAAADASTGLTYTNSYGDTVSMSGVVLVAARGDGHKGETDPDLVAKDQEAAAASPTAVKPGTLSTAPADSSLTPLEGQQKLLQKAYSQA